MTLMLICMLLRTFPRYQYLLTSSLSKSVTIIIERTKYFLIFYRNIFWLSVGPFYGWPWLTAVDHLIKVCSMPETICSLVSILIFFNLFNFKKLFAVTIGWSIRAIRKIIVKNARSALFVITFLYLNISKNFYRRH